MKIPVKDEEGDESLKWTKEEWNKQKVAKVFLTLEMEGGDKVEFFSDEHAGEPIEITKEFLETYE